MIVFRIKVITGGGTVFDYTIREVDISPAIEGEHLQVSDLLSAAEIIYGMSEDVGALMDMYKFEVTQEDI
jgi:hypothetical protein